MLRSRRDFLRLWREFLPLSLSDVVMAVSDPLTTLTLSHLPSSRVGLAALGVAKPFAVLFESPVIMLLHASNSLAGAGAASRRALWQFMLVMAGVLTAGLMVLALPPVFDFIGTRWLGIGGELLDTARHVLLFLLVWPAASGWRRYYQGLLIHEGYSRDVGRASMLRLIATAGLLGVGFFLKLPGWVVAGSALVGGIVVEALTVTVVACLVRRVVATRTEGKSPAPKSVGAVWHYYRPLATSMVVVWGSRALLVVAVARAIDAELALAAWPAAWGLVLLVANATRMVQQVIIRRRGEYTYGFLLAFAGSVGLACTAFLVFLAATPWGATMVALFVGRDAALVERVQPVVVVCALVPVLVAFQNAFQGFLIGRGATGSVSRGAWLGATALLSTAFVTVFVGVPGALAAGIAMISALVLEVTFLGLTLRKAEGVTHESGKAIAHRGGFVGRKPRLSV